MTAFGALHAEDFPQKSRLTRIPGRNVFTGLYSKDKYDVDDRQWDRSLGWFHGVPAWVAAKRFEAGLNVAELRPWRCNLVTNYNFTIPALKGFSLGGS